MQNEELLEEELEQFYAQGGQGMTRERDTTLNKKQTKTQDREREKSRDQPAQRTQESNVKSVITHDKGATW